MSGPKLQIRKFAPDDLPALHQVRSAAFAPIFASFRALLGPDIAPIALARAEAEQAEHLEQLCKPDTPGQVFVGTFAEEIVGFVSISLDHGTEVGELDLNAVHPNHAGRGFGTQLYEFALQQMRSAGMKVAAVGTGADESHAPARRTYAKVGFGPTIPNQWMYRRL